MSGSSNSGSSFSFDDFAGDLISADTLEYIVDVCVRRFGITKMDDIMNLTTGDIRRMMESEAFAELRKLKDDSESAIMNRNATVTDKKGKYLYQEAKDIIDVDKAYAKLDAQFKKKQFDNPDNVRKEMKLVPVEFLNRIE